MIDFPEDSGNFSGEDFKTNNPDKMKTSEEIKKIVNEKYSQIARQSSRTTSCCCNNSAKSSDFTDLSEDYAGLEGYLKDADLGLGCGIPTTFARLKRGDTVVDLGSGAGNDCFIAHAEVGDEGKVIGIDMSAEMIEKARQNTQKLRLSNVEFRLGEIESLPIEDGSADVVISNCVLNLVPDKNKTMKEIFRVIRPGGHFTISDVILKKPLPAKLREEAELYVGCISGAVLMDEYLDHIMSSGFIKTEILQEKRIDLPLDLLSRYLNDQELEKFQDKESGVFSVTIYAEKPRH